MTQVFEKSPVIVSQAAFDGLEYIRQSGLTNMLAMNVVHDLAEDFDFEETAMWIEEAPNGLYTRGIFNGFEVEN